jgi:hypothetical protein
MAGEVMQLFLVIRLKEALQATSRDKIFADYKCFSFVSTILNNEAFWECLFAIIQALYPILGILHLADMKWTSFTTMLCRLIGFSSQH